LSYGGGLVISHTLAATVTGCLFEQNDAWESSGLSLWGAGRDRTRFLLSNSTFVDNGRGLSGGIQSGGYTAAFTVSEARARIEGNTIHGNSARNDFGAAAIHFSDLTFTGNSIVGNDNGCASGLYLHWLQSFTVTNNIIAGNQTAQSGCPAVQVNAGSGQFVHNTIAGNPGGYGLQIDSGATVWLTNTLLVSHTVGISVSAGNTVTVEGTLWGLGPWANDTEWAGAIGIGAVNVRASPDFVNPASGDYHIGVGSGAIDAGVATAVTADIDGDPRPYGSGYDIGADEYAGLVERRWVYLPLLKR